MNLSKQRETHTHIHCTHTYIHANKHSTVQWQFNVAYLSGPALGGAWRRPRKKWFNRKIIAHNAQITQCTHPTNYTLHTLLRLLGAVPHYYCGRTPRTIYYYLPYLYAMCFLSHFGTMACSFIVLVSFTMTESLCPRIKYIYING